MTLSVLCLWVERMDYEAAEAFFRMAFAVCSQGVWLIPISGFRSYQTQNLLFQVQIQRRGSPAAAALISAPPGHSEHHTGYALDIGDGHRADTDTMESFAHTAASAWLHEHGHEYSFEESFPPHNPLGVENKPWHWRFTGPPKAEAIFAWAHPLEAAAHAKAPG